MKYTLVNLRMDGIRLGGRSRVYDEGSILIFMVVLMFVASLVIMAVLGNATSQLRLTRSSQDKELAFHIAEAGVNYYQWHLAHFVSDYADGSGQTGCNPCGPYVHDFKDFDTDQVVGQYSLNIYPPPTGTTVVTIVSTGYTLANPKVKRVVTVKYGVPSLAQYAFLTNGSMWIGNTESVSGQLFSNGGIRFDGTGNAPIQSAKATYTCPSWSGSPCPTTKPGIWGSAAAATQAYWQYPQPAIDFSTITSDLAAMKASAQAGGIYLAPSGGQGYSLVFNSNGTLSVYVVNSLQSNPTGYDVNNVAHNEYLDYSGRTLQSTQAIPSNGIIFVEDRVWVEGTLTGRATVAAAKFPYNATTAPSILIPNNLVYTAKDNTNSLGLIAQQDVLVTYHAPANLKVDAALIAQNGSAQFYYYPGNVKTGITIYGSTASFGTWTWSWVDGGGNTISGYTNTSTIYDSSLLYGPPPSFPLSTSGYQQISWNSN